MCVAGGLVVGWRSDVMPMKHVVMLLVVVLFILGGALCGDHNSGIFAVFMHIVDSFINHAVRRVSHLR